VINLIRSEFIKFRSVRSTIITLVIGGAIVVLVAVLVARDASGDTVVTCEPVAGASASATPETVPETIPEDGVFLEGPSCGDGFEAVEAQPVTNLTGLTGGVSFAVLIFGVLGVQIIGQEYRFNTIRPTFTAAPNRIRVLAAKLVVVSVAVAAVSVVMVGFCWLVGVAMLDNFTIDEVDRRVAWGIPLFAALWTMAGMGVGAIVRQPIAGILILVGESLIAESLIGGLFTSTLPWLPFSNGFQMTLRVEDADQQLRGVLGGGIYFAVVCAVLWGIGAALANRRDA